ncbi:MAG: hypothetical protein HQL29_06330, partial [Candidatus Omnitrophica bacterium]|nr:hypothetical protein [Candidatus Omnitrophota bacterium]
MFKEKGFALIDMDKEGFANTINGDLYTERINDPNTGLMAKIKKIWLKGEQTKRRIAVLLNTQPDALMRRGIWDPSQAVALKPTQEIIKLINSSLIDDMPQAIGSIFDGDADRLSAVLEDSRAVPAFEMTLPYYQRFLADPENQ